MEECDAGDFNYPGTYMAGVYNRLTSKVVDRDIENEDFVNVINWLPIKFKIDGGWMDDIILHDEPLCKDGYVTVPDKPGLGIELNPDVVKAHLMPGETWWG